MILHGLGLLLAGVRFRADETITIHYAMARYTYTSIYATQMERVDCAITIFRNPKSRYIARFGSKDISFELRIHAFQTIIID